MMLTSSGCRAVTRRPAWSRRGRLALTTALGFCLAFGCYMAAPVQADTPAEKPAITANTLPELDLEALVTQARARNQTFLKIPPGTYRLAKSGTELTGVEDLTIDGTGVTLVFSDSSRYGLYLVNSRRVTLRGFTLDFDPLPFTQATITRVAADGTRLDFRVHDGYPHLSAFPMGPQAYVFDGKTRLWKPGVGDLYGKVESLNPAEGSIDLGRKIPELSSVVPGDFLVFTSRGAGAVNLSRSSDVRVEDVTVLSAPGLGVSGRRMEGKNYFRFTVKRGPRPEGATQDRLVSTGADAFNYADSRQGPVVEKCDFSFMGDDAVNLHGPSWPVYKVEGNALWVLSSNGKTDFQSLFKPGDRVRIMEPRTFAVRGERALVSWEFDSETPVIAPEQFQQYWPQRTNRGKISCYKVTLNEPGLVQPGDFIDFPAANASGFTIRDSYFHDHRARSLRIQASDGLIENNRFERVKGSAISIGTEMAFWREAGWPTNITVRGNTIRDVGQGADIYQPGSYTPGAISLFVRLDKLEPGQAPHEINGIRILDNIIDGCSVAGIHVNVAREVLIRGNRLSRVNLQAAPQAGSRYGLVSNNPITVQNSVAVVQENNVGAAPVIAAAGR